MKKFIEWTDTKAGKKIRLQYLGKKEEAMGIKAIEEKPVFCCDTAYSTAIRITSKGSP
jgi:hypothetical protein